MVVRSCGGGCGSIIILSSIFREVELTLSTSVIGVHIRDGSSWLGFTFGVSFSEGWVLFLGRAASACPSVEFL